MIISFLIQNLGIRGSVRRVVELSNHLTLRGHAVTVYHGDGGKCEWLPMFSRGRPVTDFTQEQQEIVIFFGNPHYEIVRTCEAQAKIYYILGLNPDVPNVAEILTGKLGKVRTPAKIITDPAFTLIANCTALAEFIQGIAGRECIPVLGGVNFRVFRPSSDPVPDLIVGGGSRREIEGTTDILTVFDMIKQVRPQAKLELYAGKGLSQPELAQLIASASVFIDAQHYGGWNNAVAEAFACGAPTVCTNIHGNQDFVRDGENAVMVQPHDIESMFNAAMQILDNPEQALQFSAAAQISIAPYTWERATDQLEAVIERAVCAS